MIARNLVENGAFATIRLSDEHNIRMGLILIEVVPLAKNIFNFYLQR